MANDPENTGHKLQYWWDLTRFSIAQRIIGLLTIPFAVLVVSGFMFVKDLRQTAQRTEDTKVKITTQESASAAHTEFGKLRYWLTDLSVRAECRHCVGAVQRTDRRNRGPRTRRGQSRIGRCQQLPQQSA